MPRNEENINQAKEVCEASLGSSIFSCNGGQHKNGCFKFNSNKVKYNGGDNNGNCDNFGNGVQKRLNSCICYYKRNKYGWNNTHTSGFLTEMQHDPRDLCLLVYHDYWKFLVTAPNHGTNGRSSGGGGTK